MNSNILLIGSLLCLFVASILWHVGDAFFLRNAVVGQWFSAIRWLILSFLSVPLFALSTYGLFLVKRAWWLVELPYWIMGLVLSIFLFRQVLSISVSWREILSGVLLILIAFLLYER
jgi:hypothetical protein